MTRALLLLSCAACAATGDGRLAARVKRPQIPELRFEVAAHAARCRAGHGVLIEAAGSDGYGVLVWLRGDSLSPGEYPLRTASDTTAGPAATASLRYMGGDIAHGLALDSGVVRLTAVRPRLAGEVAGWGTELVQLQHVNLDARFAGVAVGADSTACAPA